MAPPTNQLLTPTKAVGVFKQAGKLNAEHKGKGPPSDSDDEETRQRNTGGQKQFPPKVTTVNMVYVMHIPTGERKRALRDAYAIEPVAPKFSQWAACPISFDRKDHPASIRHEGSSALVLDPIIDGLHLMKVLMDAGSSLNLLY